MDTATKYFKKLLVLCNYLGCALIMFLTVMIMIDVCGRLLFNRPLIGTAEVIQMAIVAIAFLVIPYVQSENQHLNVTMLYGKMPDAAQRTVDCITCLLGIALFTIIAVGSFDLMMKGIAAGEYEGDGFNVKIPTFWLRGTIVFCSCTNVIAYLWQFVRRIRGKDMVMK